MIVLKQTAPIGPGNEEAKLPKKGLKVKQTSIKNS